MSRCRGCNVEINVSFFVPKSEPGIVLAPILENLCGTCKYWSMIETDLEADVMPVGDFYYDSPIEKE